MTDYRQRNLNEFRFKDWNVYKDSKKLVGEIFEITKKFPPSYQYDLGSQLNRASISILLNIAEGSGKHSDADLNRFFNISLGSINEVFAGLDIAQENKLLSSEKFDDFKKQLSLISSQLVGFKKRLDK